MNNLFARPSRRQLLADNEQLRAHLFDLGTLSEIRGHAVVDLHEPAAQAAVETEPLGDLLALDGPALPGGWLASAVERVLPAADPLADQPLLLPTDVIQARIELGLVRADLGRVERINDGLRAQLREKDAVVLALMGELTQARLAILEPRQRPDMVVPWQTLSSAA